MNLLEIQSELIKHAVLFENTGAAAVSGSTGSAGTTASNIAYTPQQFPQVQKRLTHMSKRKKTWGVTVYEGPQDYTVSMEDYTNIVVPVAVWENFKSQVFGMHALPSGPFQVDLNGYLLEAYDDAQEEALGKLKAVVVQFLNSDQCKYYRHKIASFVNDSGDPNLNFSRENNTLFSDRDLTGDLSNLFAYISKYLKTNIGEIDLITHSFQSREPLSGVEIFSKFDNIISSVVNGSFQGVDFWYSAKINMNFISEELLQLNNQEVLTRLAADQNFKVEGNKVYPISESGFPSNISQVLTKYIKGA